METFLRQTIKFNLEILETTPDIFTDEEQKEGIPIKEYKLFYLSNPIEKLDYSKIRVLISLHCHVASKIIQVSSILTLCPRLLPLSNISFGGEKFSTKKVKIDLFLS